MDWTRLHHLHLGVYGGLISAIIATAGLVFHKLTLCGYSAGAGALMLGWAFDDFISEKWKVKMPSHYLELWLNKLWIYDRIKKWINKVFFKKEGANVDKH